jgi:hypothetical protein
MHDKKCQHDHIRFEDGTMHLVCIDCEQVWGGLDRKGGKMDHSLQQQTRTYTPDTRHNRWVIPRVTHVASVPRVASPSIKKK